MRIVLAFLLLAGCASTAGDVISEFNPEQLRVLPTNSLCKPYVQGPNVTAERQRRGLSDCSPADQACASAGYPAGSPNYAHCRATASSQAYDQCYFNGPVSGRLGGSLSNTDVICSAQVR
jgi:hypothetical protein